MEQEILQAIKSRREMTGGRVGPSIREIESDTGRAFAGIHNKLMQLIEDGLLYAAWLENGNGRRLVPRSLDITEEGLRYLEAADESLETA